MSFLLSKLFCCHTSVVIYYSSIRTIIKVNELFIFFFSLVELKELAKEGYQRFRSIDFLSMTSGTGTLLEMVITVA